jgi:hypothetical protein
VYLTLGIDLTGNQQMLGLWIRQTEGEQHSQEIDHASAKLEARAEPVYHPFGGKDADELTLAPFKQKPGHLRPNALAAGIDCNTQALA